MKLSFVKRSSKVKCPGCGVNYAFSHPSNDCRFSQHHSDGGYVQPPANESWDRYKAVIDGGGSTQDARRAAITIGPLEEFDPLPEVEIVPDLFGGSSDLLDTPEGHPEGCSGEEEGCSCGGTWCGDSGVGEIGTTKKT